jgi:hypothetical protein
MNRHEYIKIVSKAKSCPETTRLSFLTLGPCTLFSLIGLTANSLEEAYNMFMNTDVSFPELNTGTWRLCSYPGHYFVCNDKGKIVINTGANPGPVSGINVLQRDEKLVSDINLFLKFICSEVFVPLYACVYGDFHLTCTNSVNLFKMVVIARKKNVWTKSLYDLLNFKSNDMFTDGVYVLSVSHTENTLESVVQSRSDTFVCKHGDQLIIDTPLFVTVGAYADSKTSLKEISLDETFKSIASTR